MKAHYALLTTAALLLSFALAAPAAAFIFPVQNGDFENGLNFWGPGSTGPGSHEVNVIPEGIPGLNIDILNLGSGGQINWTAAFQNLDQDVGGAPCLYIFSHVRVISQSNISPLHEPCDFEFPAILRLHYTDASGHARMYMHGFYINGTLGHVTDATEVIASESYYFMSPNLMTYLPFTPEHLTGVEVLGVGWDYHSQFDNVEIRICEVPEASSLAGLAALIPGLVLTGLRRRR